MSASPARRAASHLLETVLEAQRPLEEALDGVPPMDPRDKAAGHRIAAAVLRRLGSLDAAMEPWLRRAPPAPALRALRIGAAELLLLGTPPHAAVASAVSLAPRPLAGLVNAVLRRLAEAGPAALDGLDAERLDTPPWLWAAWHAAHGEAVRPIAAAHRVEAPLDLSLRPGATPPEGATLLPTGTARLPAGTRITELPGFAEGDFWAQDMAAALPARLLAAREGEHVADLCAAPGGKTAQLALTGARVVAVERDSVRMGRLRENMLRLRIAPELVCEDMARWQPAAPLDAVLLDAPCTATGTIRRHPDLPHLRRPKDVSKLAQEQRRLLHAAARMLRPGGRMVFATCSLQAEEGEAHLAALPEGMRLDPIRPEELPGLEGCITPQGALRTRPDQGPEGGMDGFFVMRLARVGG
ncbi:RsmB/NOP family class I SAM-dependent RNA methyltransferase [Roseococcus suduntuyensis]|uniref:16S rRNA (Cytosine967-C5)-methyltransferase n=1 Tax=Roseococcus suduntuyensis TaxID=455361 RepID=A0A840A7S5_9PROT|nr:transcription antitermination factor NusB [Roseococcus suduntuyensis]MBB3897167.1 16S rRNA (cytosine967-C5)-methyltransferase [Roseococcus suduntuyensis]